MSSPSEISWAGAGKPGAPFKKTTFKGICATCGSEIEGDAVHVGEIDNPTFSNHADFFRFEGKHVCPACAWLYGAGKGKPGNYIATPESMEFTVISMDSVVASKRPWAIVLAELAGLPKATPVTGVMTTDVKPRLWPRARTATIGRFGLYIHCPDYDVSEWRNFDLSECLGIIEAISPMLAAGFSKASLWFGLFRDYTRTAKSIDAAWAWESQLITLRASPAFLPALIAAGVKKGEAHGIRN